jgi:hypothetical protein
MAQAGVGSAVWVLDSSPGAAQYVSTLSHPIIHLKYVCYYGANNLLGVMGKTRACSPAGGAVGSAVDGAAAVSVLVGVSVLEPVVPFVALLSEVFPWSFLKRDLSLSILAGLCCTGVRRG